MPSCYLKRGNSYRVSSKEDLDLHDFLPPNNFVLGADMQGFFLSQVDSFEFNHKIYGEVEKQSKKILNSFNERPNSTGVLLAGDKGSGKTLLAKYISHRASQQGIPTLIINAPHNGDAFNNFIQTIEQPMVIMFDEFEKVYSTDEQQAILTLLDGVFPSKKLFILTCNNKWRIDEHMRNRPGRIYYMLDFEGLEVSFIEEYAKDNLKNKANVNGLVQISQIYDTFNFDMLKALVEEMNRYNETASEAIKMLNVRIEYSSEIKYNVRLFVEGKEIPQEQLSDGFLEINFMKERFFNIEYLKNPTSNQSSKPQTHRAELTLNTIEDSAYEFATFYHTDLVKIEEAGKRYIFKNKEGVVGVFDRVEKEKSYNYYNF